MIRYMLYYSEISKFINKNNYYEYQLLMLIEILCNQKRDIKVAYTRLEKLKD